jgi:hypothetical protein
VLALTLKQHDETDVVMDGKSMIFGAIASLCYAYVHG